MIRKGENRGVVVYVQWPSVKPVKVKVNKNNKIKTLKLVSNVKSSI